MKRYVKNADVSQVFIPGVGRLTEGMVLVGDEYAKFAPRFLTEVPEMPNGAPLESTQPRTGPSLLTEPTHAPAIPVPTPEPLKLEEEAPLAAVAAAPEEKRPRGRPRKNA